MSKGLDPDQDQHDVGPDLYMFAKFISRRQVASSKERVNIYGPQHKKTCLREFANNKGTDQPAHPHRLISAFVISFLESIFFFLFDSLRPINNLSVI